MTARPALLWLLLMGVLTGCASYETKAPCGRVLAFADAADRCGPMRPVNIPFEDLLVDPATMSGADATSAQGPTG